MTELSKIAEQIEKLENIIDKNEYLADTPDNDFLSSLYNNLKVFDTRMRNEFIDKTGELYNLNKNNYKFNLFKDDQRKTILNHLYNKKNEIESK